MRVSVFDNGRLAAPAVRQHLEALVDQALVPQGLERPHDALHVRQVEGLVVVGEVDPAGLAGDVAVPVVGEPQHAGAAGVVELVDPERGDRRVALDAELLLDHHLGGQAVAVPAEAALDAVAAHRAVARHRVLDVPGEQVAVVRQAVGERRTVVEHELVGVGAPVDRRLERAVRIPELQDAGLHGGERGLRLDVGVAHRMAPAGGAARVPGPPPSGGWALQVGRVSAGRRRAPGAPNPRARSAAWRSRVPRPVRRPTACRWPTAAGDARRRARPGLDRPCPATRGRVAQPLALGDDVLLEVIDVGDQEVAPGDERLDLALGLDPLVLVDLAALDLGVVDDLRRLGAGGGDDARSFRLRVGDGGVGRALGEDSVRLIVSASVVGSSAVCGCGRRGVGRGGAALQAWARPPSRGPPG